jgi:hypothetical protein
VAPPRLADLVKKARRLAAERDRLIDALAAEWARVLRTRGLTAADLDEFWAGLTEDAVRRAGQASAGPWPAPARRHEARTIVARVRQKVEAALGER